MCAGTPENPAITHYQCLNGNDCKETTNDCPAPLEYECQLAACGPEAGDPDLPDACSYGNSAEFTPCGDPSDTTCDNPDTCNGTGTCQQNLEAGGTPCRASISECDPAEQCTGTTGICPSDDVDPDGTSCSDSAYCTVDDACNGGACVGTPRGCTDAVDCTIDSCNESLHACVHEADNSQCDDGDPCTADVCNEGIGCIFDMVCGTHICRAAGYWSTHSGYARMGAINVGQAVLDAIGGVDVCGQQVDSTSNLQSPWVEGLGLSSALEGLCVKVGTITQRQLYRQLVATALNCGITGGNCDDIVMNYIDVTFSDCSDLCATGSQAPGGPSVRQCINQLDCFNNGGQLIGGKCALGTCEQNESLFCGGGYASCPRISGRTQACEPFQGNCQSAPLCNEALGVCPKNTSTSSDKACREANSNDCTIDSCP